MFTITVLLLIGTSQNRTHCVEHPTTSQDGFVPDPADGLREALP